MEVPQGPLCSWWGEEGAVHLGLSSLLSHFGENIPPSLLRLQLSSFPLLVPPPTSPAFLVSLQSPRPAPSLVLDVCGWAASWENKALRGALRPAVLC